MAILDKDILQKEKAIRYCIANGVLPYLEVIVNNVREITDIKTVITDIDVLGVEVSRRGKIKKTLFDCKTVGKMSAINRAFWASGVMAYTGCDEAYVILNKKASEAHRLSAKTINVHLFKEEDFDVYATSANINYLNQFYYSYNISSWHSFYASFTKNEALKSLGEYINAKLPLENDSVKSLRELLGIMRSVKGELDPSKPEHMAIYTSLILSFLLVMAPISSQMSDVFDENMSKASYEHILRYYIWGGRESYIQRRELKNAFHVATGARSGELELPGWDEFVLVSRGFLDAHSQLRDALIPCRELSLRYLSKESKENDRYLSRKLRESNRVKQFMMASSGYLYKATGLPKDFHENLKASLYLVDTSESQ
ncbi:MULTISPECIES: hypothetical protein [Aeromonas]|nr:hypothetical protein [Aeromonas jandaei]